MKTTNIYYIVDCSVKTRGDTANRIKQNITKVARALKFCPCKTKLHIIGYNDKAFFIHPFNAYLP
ncbi:MAG: VWA domain-containing protein, partial [Clostridia bacterium]|nr:VWA domain-containing protein [Clostridia bacterium]